MKTSSIFKDRSKLLPGYLPNGLPHRDRQVTDLLDFFSDSIREIPNPTFKTYQIVGDVGSGKTVTTLKFSELFESQAKGKKISVIRAYLNPRQHGLNRQVIYRHLNQQVDPNIAPLNYSAEELIFQLLNYLVSQKKYLIIIFDEVDYFVQNSKDSVVYNLTRLNEVREFWEECDEFREDLSKELREEEFEFYEMEELGDDLRKLEKWKTKLVEKYPSAKDLYESLEEKLEECRRLFKTFERKCLEKGASSG